MDFKEEADHVSPPLRAASSSMRRSIRTKRLSYQRLPSVDETTVRRSNSGTSQRAFSPEATHFRESVTEAFGLGIRGSGDISREAPVETNPNAPGRPASPQVGPALTETRHSSQSRNSRSDPESPYRISRLSFQQENSDHSETEELQTESSQTPPEIRPPPGENAPARIATSDNFLIKLMKVDYLVNNNGFDCPSKRNVIQRRTSWLSIAILTLAFYSTAMSGLYLAVACVKLRYGRKIGDDGLVPSTATLLSALFAKTIELSFVTVFVAFLGQVLSRRALAMNADGVTISDMSMRTWVMQPGTLITHWENVKHSGLSVLGMIALTTTFIAMLYTTAAEALVSPKLAFSGDQEASLNGLVRQKFANTTFLLDQCQTPIAVDVDPNSKSTCMQVSYTGKSYHNYEQYLSNWVEAITKGETGELMSERPLPVGTWHDNTTVQGNWVEQHDMADLSKKHRRMIQNVTAAMPHAGVFAAARFPKNEIRQPEDLGGQGEFEIKAAAASPAVNVVCAGMTAKELEPLVYDKWPHRGKKNATEGWVVDPPKDLPRMPDWLNRTVVDDIFGWGEKYGQRPPLFPKIPIPYNTILNASAPWGANSIYIIGTSPPHIKNPPHFLCALKGGLASMCSTRYHATSSGGELKTHCDDPEDNLAYFRHVEGEPAPALAVDPDFRVVAEEWSKAIGLNTGMVDAHGSNARILTGLVTSYDNKTNTSALDSNLPSAAEALAVMASSLMMQATHEAPFKHYWNNPDFHEPYVEQVSAFIRSSDYFSGGSQKWQGVFYVVLALVFVTNLICLVYMYLDFRGVQLTDFTEPQNAFVLALNSPGSRRVRGACGGGPEGSQLTQRWVITMDERDEHYYITSKGERSNRNRSSGGADGDSYSDKVPLSPNMLSPMVEEYRRLSHNKNSTSLLVK